MSFLSRLLRPLQLVLLCAALASAQSDDHWFPRFHPRPKTHWVNDPDGPMYYNGLYHLFTQYAPHSAVWADDSWSHLISHDLAYWFEMPVALTPDHDYDAGGVFSGSTTVLPDGSVYALYTCVDANQTERQCLAYPKDLTDPYLQEWVKDENNPIIADPPPLGDGKQFRDDTTAWMVNGTYFMAVGASINSTASVWIYTSTDFKNWTSIGHPLFTNGSHGIMFECPDFFPATDQGNPQADSVYALKVSWNWLDYYLLGTYDSSNNKFSLNSPFNIYDHGKIYASKSFWDPIGMQQIVYGWSAEDFDTSSFGWQGTITMPRALTYNAQFNMLNQHPIDNLKLLRVKSSFFTASAVLASNSYWDCSSHNGSFVSNQFEIVANFDFSACNLGPCTAGVSVLSSFDGTQATNFYVSQGQPVGPFVNQSISVPNLQQIGNITLPKHSTRPVLTAKCQNLCSETPECVTWTFVANYSWDDLSTLSFINSSSAPISSEAHRLLKETHTASKHKHSDYPANPYCFLFSGSDLDPTTTFLSTYCTDCATGLDYSDSQYPILVMNRTFAGQGENGAVVVPLFAAIPSDPAAPTTAFEVRAFVDHSIIEVFVNNLAVITSRSYPDESSVSWGVYSGNSQGLVSVNVSAWQLLDAVA